MERIRGAQPDRQSRGRELHRAVMRFYDSIEKAEECEARLAHIERHLDEFVSFL